MPVFHALALFTSTCASNSAWRTRSKVLKSSVMTFAVGQVAAAVVISPSTTMIVFGDSREQRARPSIESTLEAPHSNSSVCSVWSVKVEEFMLGEKETISCFAANWLLWFILE